MKRNRAQQEHGRESLRKIGRPKNSQMRRQYKERENARARERGRTYDRVLGFLARARTLAQDLVVTSLVDGTLAHFVGRFRWFAFRQQHVAAAIHRRVRAKALQLISPLVHSSDENRLRRARIVLRGPGYRDSRHSSAQTKEFFADFLLPTGETPNVRDLGNDCDNAPFFTKRVPRRKHIY